MYHLTHYGVTPFVHTSPAHVLIGFNSSPCNSRGPHLATGSAPFNIAIGQLGSHSANQTNSDRVLTVAEKKWSNVTVSITGGKSWAEANRQSKIGLIGDWCKHNMEDIVASFIIVLLLSSNRWLVSMYNLLIHLADLPPVLAGGLAIIFLAQIRSLKKTVGTVNGIIAKQYVWPGECPHLLSNINIH